MPLSFPDSPTLGTTAVGTNGATYYYDGTKWIINSGKIPQVAGVIQGDTSVQVSDTGTGAINVVVDGTLIANVNSTHGLQIRSNLFKVVDNTDLTKKAIFDASSITSGAIRTITFPDASGTLTFSTTAGTISNKTLDNTNAITIRDANLTIQDNLDATKQMRFELSNISASNTRILSVPDASGEIALIDAVQAIDNKTLNTTNTYVIFDSNLELASAANSFTKARFSLELVTESFIGEIKSYILPDANTTLVGDNIAQTLTNKTISSATLTGTTSVGRNTISQPKLLDPSVVSVALGTLSTGTTTINLANGNHFTATITSAATVTFSLAALSGLTNQAVAWTMELTNAGDATINWFSGIKWPNGFAPTLSTGAGIVDVLTFVTADGGTTIRGILSQVGSQ